MTNTLSRLGPTRTRILLMVIDCHARGRPFKLREVARVVGCHHNNICQHLAALRRRGLVDWQGHKAGTVVPCCRFISPEDLAAATDGPAAE